MNHLRNLFLVSGLTLGGAMVTWAQPTARPADFHQWAPTPPVGWNSWDCYGPTVTEAETKANADYMAKYLKASGWEYAVVDIRWYVGNDTAHGYNEKNPYWNIDQYGRFVPAPNGVGHLVQTASKEGIKFGIWIEPEMVNPRSELYEQHPDWILKLPGRPEDYYRHQLVLDLTNPKVQDFVFGIVDAQLSQGAAYLKWDCNRMITNGYSQHLGKNQSHLYVDYVRGLYQVLERVRQKYPHTPMMLCSGGGARADYGGLKYFTEFWPSDDTDAFERVFIQWGFLNFFPSNTLACHVTNWNQQLTLKFRTDVAMMGKLGYDIEVSKMTPAELQFSQQAVRDYQRLSSVIWQGALFKLRSPYEGNQVSLMYVADNQRQAVLYGYNLHTRFHETVLPTRLQGLDPARRYRLTEINLLPGQKSALPASGQTYSGDYLMKVGVLVSDGEAKALTSHIIELTAE